MMYFIAFYVPPVSAESVKGAMFSAGAGKIGNYSHCCFQYSGQGQFQPEVGAKPAIGSVGHLELVNELKVEMVCDERYISAVVSAMKASHPYEEVAYHVVRIESFGSSAESVGKI
jgi:hypothetical protein